MTTQNDAPEIAGAKPMLVRLGAKGTRVFWCACGRSKTQPFCDGSHKGTQFSPVPYLVAADGEEKLFCLCKRTRTPPFCDGAHNALDAGYALASAAEIAAGAGARTAPFDADGVARLDGGAYALRPAGAPVAAAGDWRVVETAGAALGARHVSQFLLTCGAQRPAPLSFGPSSAVLFFAEGAGEAAIGGVRVAVTRDCAIALRPGETAALALEAPARIVATATPQRARPDFTAATDAFDAAFPDRVGRVDPEARRAMGDRFYQVLADAASGAGEQTQFIGEIPRSRAAMHRHLYEEAIFILAGSGVLWTETRRADVIAGDVVFLPMRQIHSLEATSAAGMRLAGAFFPSGSPAVNY